MTVLRKVWITECGKDSNDLVSLSFESVSCDVHNRIHVREGVFPEWPTKDYPRRHVIVLSYLSKEDLEMMHKAIKERLKKKREGR